MAHHGRYKRIVVGKRWPSFEYTVSVPFTLEVLTLTEEDIKAFQKVIDEQDWTQRVIETFRRPQNLYGTPRNQ